MSTEPASKSLYVDRTYRLAMIIDVPGRSRLGNAQILSARTDVRAKEKAGRHLRLRGEVAFQRLLLIGQIAFRFGEMLVNEMTAAFTFAKASQGAVKRSGCDDRQKSRNEETPAVSLTGHSPGRKWTA